MIRFIQDLRKKEGFKPSDFAKLSYKSNEEGKKLLEKYETIISKPTLIKKIETVAEEGESLDLDGIEFKIKMSKM